MIISTAELEKYFGKEATPAKMRGADHDFAGRVERETAARAGKGSEKDGAGQVTTSRHFVPRALPFASWLWWGIYPPSPPVFSYSRERAVKGASHRRFTAACLDGLPRLCYFPSKRRGYILQSRPFPMIGKGRGDWAELSY